MFVLAKNVISIAEAIQMHLHLSMIGYQKSFKDQNTIIEINEGLKQNI